MGLLKMRSAVNFPLDEPVPAKLIGLMSKFQAEDIEARSKDKVKDKAKSGAKAGAKAKTKAAKKKPS